MWTDAVFPEVSSTALVIILRVCVCVCVCMSAEHRLPRPAMYIFVLFAFGFPLCCAFHPWTARQSGVLCGLERERNRERWGHQERVKTDRKREEDGSFERLLTSKPTVMAALAGGESTSKHTRWVMKWSGCTSRVISHVPPASSNTWDFCWEMNKYMCLKGQ